MAVSTELGAQGTKRTNNPHRGMAFLIEALVVLAFLMASLAIFVKLFSGAQLEGISANRRSQAVLLATNVAEEFSAHPTGVAATIEQDGLVATCSVEELAHKAGTLYNATIAIADGGNEVYVLHTARYVSAAEKSGGA